MKRIAILQMGALGDIILAFPIAAVIRDKHPSDRITWLCFDQYRDTVAACDAIDDYIAWPLSMPRLERVKPNRTYELDVWDAMKEYAKKNFDVVYKPQVYPDHEIHSNGVHLLDTMFANAGLKRPVNAGLWSHWRDDQVCGYIDASRCVTLNYRGVSNGELMPMADIQRFAAECVTQFGLMVTCADATIVGCRRVEMTVPQWRNFIVNKSALHVSPDSGGAWIGASTAVRQVVVRGSDNPMPLWLTGVADANVKDKRFITEIEGTLTVDDLLSAVSGAIK